MRSFTASTWQIACYEISTRKVASFILPDTEIRGDAGQPAVAAVNPAAGTSV